MTVAFRSSRHQVQRLSGETVEATWWAEAPATYTEIRAPYGWSSWTERVTKPLSVLVGIKGGATAHWLTVAGEFVLALAPKSGGPMVEIPPHYLEEVAS